MKSARTLLIDDNAEFCSCLFSDLNDYKHDVIIASNVNEGIGLLLKESIDLVFLDYDFGAGMTGIDFLDVIDKYGIKIPVIMISANESALGIARTKYPSLVIDEFEKPYRKHDLERVIRTYNNWKHDNEIKQLSTPIALIKEQLDTRTTYYQKVDFLGHFFEGIISYIAAYATCFACAMVDDYTPSLIIKKTNKNLTMGDYAAITTESLKLLKQEGHTKALFEGGLMPFFAKNKFSTSYTFLFEDCIQKRLYLGGHYAPPREENKCKEIYESVTMEFNDKIYRPFIKLFLNSLWMPENLKQVDGKIVYNGRQFNGPDIKKTMINRALPPADGSMLPDDYEGKLFIYNFHAKTFIPCNPYIKVFNSKQFEFQYVPFVFKNTNFVHDERIQNYKDFSFFDLSFYS